MTGTDTALTVALTGNLLCVALNPLLGLPIFLLMIHTLSSILWMGAMLLVLVLAFRALRWFGRPVTGSVERIPLVQL